MGYGLTPENSDYPLLYENVLKSNYPMGLAGGFRLGQRGVQSSPLRVPGAGRPVSRGSTLSHSPGKPWQVPTNALIPQQRAVHLVHPL